MQRSQYAGGRLQSPACQTGWQLSWLIIGDGGWRFSQPCHWHFGLHSDPITRDHDNGGAAVTAAASCMLAGVHVTGAHGTVTALESRKRWWTPQTRSRSMHQGERQLAPAPPANPPSTPTNRRAGPATDRGMRRTRGASRQREPERNQQLSRMPFGGELGHPGPAALDSPSVIWHPSLGWSGMVLA